MANFPQDSHYNRRGDGQKRGLRDSMNAGNNGNTPARRVPPPDEDDEDENWAVRATGNEDNLEQTSLAEKESILASLQTGGGGGVDPAETEKMRTENEQLRSIIDELRGQLEETAGKGQELWEDREKEYEAMLEQKSETIRELHVRMQELEQTGTGGGNEGGEERKPAGPGGRDDSELLALSDELERERCALEQERRQLEDDRHQLREDEEAMMRQMREMELQMAKERAELARQRNELQRLHSEIRHELELAQRDAAVNERLRLLQRRTQDVAEGNKGSAAETPTTKKNPPPPGGAQPTRQARPTSQSLFGRFLGGNK